MTSGIFKWRGQLNARKIVERMIANIVTGAAMGIGFWAIGWLLG